MRRRPFGRIELTVGVAVGVLVAALAGEATGGGAPDPFDGLGVQRPAEPTPAPDVAFRSLDGREVRLHEFRGKVVLLGFFSTD